MISVEPGSKVKAVRGKISAKRSIVRICIARIGIGQPKRATPASPKRTILNSAPLLVNDAIIVFLRLL